jgi:hypothetical protein
MKLSVKRLCGQIGVMVMALALWAGSAHAMVYVSSISDLMSNGKTLDDLFYLSHVDYALQKTGGDLVDSKIGLAGLKPDETLHIVAHGSEGSLQGIPMSSLAKVLKTIPKDYKGRVVVTACYSSAVVAGDKSTLRQIADALKADGHKVTLIGNKGPSITNIHMNPSIAYVSAANTPAAGKIQGDMTGSKGAYAKLFPDWKVKSAALVKSKTDAKAMVRAAGEYSKDFYQAFYDTLSKAGLISPENEMLTSIDIM